MSNHIVNNIWNNLPLKKRPLKDNMILPARIDSSLSNYYHASCYSVINYQNKKRLRSISPVSSEYSINSYDSGFVDNNSPLDLSSPVSRKENPSPDVFKYDVEVISKFSSESDSLIKCHECKKHFTNRIRYKAHLRRHASKKSGRYRCEQCHKTFVQRSSLLTHLRIHTGEKPFKCTDCDNSFGDFSTYTKHKRIHSGEKPYICPVCQRAFSQSGNMHRHYNTIHKQN